MKTFVISTNTKTVLDAFNGNKGTHKYLFKAESEKEAVVKFKEMFGSTADWKVVRVVE